MQNMFITPESFLNMHSHVIGLGLNEKGMPMDISDGMAYQNIQRKKAAILVQLLKNKTLDRRFIMIQGPACSGKTALAKAIIHESCCYNNNVVLLKSELTDATRDPLQTITQALRKVLKLRITQDNFVINGEVVKVNYDEPAPGVSGSVGSIILQTRHMSAIYGLGENIIKKLQKLQIQKGDVISIQTGSGRVFLFGQTDETKPNYCPCPTGELSIRRPLNYIISMHELDVYNNCCNSNQESNPVNYVKIRENLRQLVNHRVAKWLEEGKAELFRGVLLIEDLQFLPLESYLYLQEADHKFLPYVIMDCREDIVELLPFSPEFLRRVVKIETVMHSIQAINAILILRCHIEKLSVKPKSFKVLKMFADINLQFAVQLINMMKTICEQMHCMPGLSLTYSGENIIEVSEKFMNILINHGVNLKFDCEVAYEKTKYPLKLKIISKT